MPAANVGHAGKRGNICVRNNVSSFARAFRSCAYDPSVRELHHLHEKRKRVCFEIDLSLTVFDKSNLFSHLIGF